LKASTVYLSYVIFKRGKQARSTGLPRVKDLVTLAPPYRVNAVADCVGAAAVCGGVAVFAELLYAGRRGLGQRAWVSTDWSRLWPGQSERVAL